MQISNIKLERTTPCPLLLKEGSNKPHPGAGMERIDMQYIITRMKSTEGGCVSWRVTVCGDIYKTVLWLKAKDLRDLLEQIKEQNKEIVP